jgi:hypothetical protein
MSGMEYGFENMLESMDYKWGTLDAPDTDEPKHITIYLMTGESIDAHAIGMDFKGGDGICSYFDWEHMDGETILVQKGVIPTVNVKNVNMETGLFE